MTVLSSVIDVIGNTPLVRLDRLVKARGLEGAILAKLDYLNPGFSKKDRAARGLIEEAETSGQLAPGQTVVELTSGNMGGGAGHRLPHQGPSVRGGDVERQFARAGANDAGARRRSGAGRPVTGFPAG